MTVTVLQETIGKYYIKVSQDKYESSYKTEVLEKSIGDLYRIVNSHYYSTLKQAKQRYNYLKRRAKKGDI